MPHEALGLIRTFGGTPTRVVVIAGPFGSGAAAEFAVVPVYGESSLAEGFQPAGEDVQIDATEGADGEWWAAAWNARTVRSERLGSEIGKVHPDVLDRLRDIYFSTLDGTNEAEYELSDAGAAFQCRQARSWNSATLENLVRDEAGGDLWHEVSLTVGNDWEGTALYFDGDVVITPSMIEAITRSEGHGIPLRVGEWFTLTGAVAGQVVPVPTRETGDRGLRTHRAVRDRAAEYHVSRSFVERVEVSFDLAEGLVEQSSGSQAAKVA